MIKLLMLLVVSSLSAYDIDYKRYIKTYDGDTVYVDLKCSEPLVCDNIGIRFLRVNCDEMRNKDLSKKQQAIKAKLFTEDFIKEGFILKNCKRDAYFRLDCEVYNTKGVNLNSLLIEKGICQEYRFQ